MLPAQYKQNIKRQQKIKNHCLCLVGMKLRNYSLARHGEPSCLQCECKKGVRNYKQILSENSLGKLWLESVRNVCWMVDLGRR